MRAIKLRLAKFLQRGEKRRLKQIQRASIAYERGLFSLFWAVTRATL